MYMSPPLPGNRNAILFTLLACPCHGLLTFHHMPTNTCDRPGRPCHSAAGPVPPVKPTGYRYCSTPVGENGAVPSLTTEPNPLVLSAMVHPSPVVKLLNPSSPITEAPLGSCGHVPDGAGCGCWGCCGGCGCCACPVAVVPLAEFDRLPNTALTLSVPRNAISWKPYAVAGDNPSTVHVRLPPIAFPASGVAQTPRVTAGAEPHDSGPTAERTS